ncbi:hypothetical protein BGZ83_006483 [Gryganskiella cystojenkinii]|nr:hypothetical protein BGZ83_006483 [Gryganskiella cystojenkinii]
MEEGLVLSPIEQILEDLIWHADQQDDYPTATRYAEILFASLSDTTPTTTRSYPSWAQREHGYYRLTQCLFRESKFQEVRKLLTSNDEDQESLRSSIRCRFKLALACHNLMYFVEANSVVEGLLKLLPVDQAPPLNIRDRNVVYEKEGTPHVSRVLALQGSITRAQGRSKEAPDFLTTSLEHNPFNLSAIKDIAELGKLDIESLYEQMLTNTNALTATTRKRQREDSASGVMEHIKEEESEDAANTLRWSSQGADTATTTSNYATQTIANRTTFYFFHVIIVISSIECGYNRENHPPARKEFYDPELQQKACSYEPWRGISTPYAYHC